MTMPISILARRVAAAAAVLGAAACADAPTGADLAGSRSVPSGLDFALIGTATRQPIGDTSVTVFTVDPRTSTSFQVGSAHVVYFPAFSICDMSTTTYGPTEWDRPCKVTGRNVTITAKSWTDASGQPQVDFSPAMRFQTRNGDDVTLALAVDSGTAAASIDRLRILYCANPLAPCVDESLTDPTLVTRVSTSRTSVYRRVKHFSGYNVSSGRTDMVDGLALSRAGGAMGLLRSAPSASRATTSTTTLSPDTSTGGSTTTAEEPVSRTGHLMSSGRTELQ